MVMRMTTNLITMDVLDSGGSHDDRSCESLSRTFDNFDIHLLNALSMSMRTNDSTNRNTGSMITKSVLQIGVMNDNKAVPLSVSSKAKSPIPAGSEIKSNPNILSIISRVTSQANMNIISRMACNIMASRPIVWTMIGHAAKYNAGSHLMMKPKGLSNRGSKKNSMLCVVSIWWLY